MRLTDLQKTNIRQTVARIVGPNAQTWLFGSRVDDNRRGGDVDLYIEPTQKIMLISALRCKIAIEESMDLQVDIIIKEPGIDKPIYRLAKTQGVLL